MEPFYKYIDEYKAQLKRGAVKLAYRGVMEYILSLRTYLAKNYPDYYVSGSIYYGYMDMTYFSFHPATFTQRKLRVGIVFIHEDCQFQAWLAGYNKQIQSKYWKLFKESGWDRYALVPDTHGVDSIIEHVLDERPDFKDLADQTKRIEKGVLKFINDIDSFLAAHSI